MSHYDNLQYLAENSDNTPDKDWLYSEQLAHDAISEAWYSEPTIFGPPDRYPDHRLIVAWLEKNYEVDELWALNWTFSWLDIYEKSYDV